MADIYWYAPFNNAGEMILAVAIGESQKHRLTVQSCAERFGRRLESSSPGNFNLIRDLPPPAGELGEGRAVWRRAGVALSRSCLRQRVVTRGSFDLVHLHTYNLFTDWYAIPLIKRRTSVVVQSVHNVRPHERVLPRFIESFMLCLGYRAYTCLIVAHDALKEQLIREFHLNPSRIHVIPLPVQSEFFAPDSSDPPQSNNCVHCRFLFFGTFRRNKGMEVLLEAIARLPETEGLQFTIAGRGDPALEEIVRSAHKADQRIEIEIGHVENERRRELFLSSDVVVMPYVEFNAQSGVLQDAYAASKPVIVSDIGALGASVRAERTGWVVPPSDAAELARMMAHVASAWEERQAAARKAASVAASRTPANIARCLLDLYEELLCDRR